MAENTALKVVYFASPAGFRAWLREQGTTARAYFEQKRVALPPSLEKKFRAQKAAWAFFQAQPPSYRRTATWWNASAKRDETQQRRFALLLAESAAGRRLARFSRQG